MPMMMLHATDGFVVDSSSRREASTTVLNQSRPAVPTATSTQAHQVHQAQTVNDSYHMI